MPKLIIEIEYEFKPGRYNPEAVVGLDVTKPENAAKLDAALVNDEGLLVFLGWMEGEEIKFEERAIGWAG